MLVVFVFTRPVRWTVALVLMRAAAPARPGRRHRGDALRLRG
jgi:hypothetical protein